MKPKQKYGLSICIGAFFLMFYALFDNFPILTSDTGTYIISGFTFEPPHDRPIFYGLFIRITSLGASVWMTVFVQCLMLSYLLFQFIKKLLPSISNKHILAIILMVSFFTMGGWFVSQLMPDIFVATMIIGVTIYFVFKNKLSENILLITIIFISVLTHNSNYIIITLFSFAVLLSSFFIRVLKPYFKRALLVGSIGVMSWFVLCASNWIGGNGFNTGNSTHVFVMGKLVESGILKTYLEKACPVKQYNICNYKDNLPPVAWSFHWDANSPLQKTGGWDANRKEYNAIISDIFSRPKYYPFIAYKSLEATARQLVLYQVDGNYILPWAKFDEGTSPFTAIEKYFPHELNQLKTSRQNTKTFNIALIDATFFLTMIISSILSLLVFSQISDNKKEFIQVLIVVVIFILLNAIVTASLSSVNARFNSRVFWIFPFLNTIIIYKVAKQIFLTIKIK